MANVVQSATQFMREVNVEFKKVIWPSRADTLTGSMAVGIFVLVTTIFLAGTDYVIASLLSLIIE